MRAGAALNHSVQVRDGARLLPHFRIFTRWRRFPGSSAKIGAPIASSTWSTCGVLRRRAHQFRSQSVPRRQGLRRPRCPRRSGSDRLAGDIPRPVSGRRRAAIRDRAWEQRAAPGRHRPVRSQRPLLPRRLGELRRLFQAEFVSTAHATAASSGGRQGAPVRSQSPLRRSREPSLGHVALGSRRSGSPAPVTSGGDRPATPVAAGPASVSRFESFCRLRTAPRRRRRTGRAVPDPRVGA